LGATDFMRDAIREVRLENAHGDSLMKHTPNIRKDNVDRFLGYALCLARKTRVVEVGLQRLYKIPWCEQRKELILEIYSYRMRADSLTEACRKVLARNAKALRR